MYNPRSLMQTMGLNQSSGVQRPQAAPDQFMARTQPVGGFQPMPGGNSYSPPNVRGGGDYGYRPLPPMNPPVQPPMGEGRVFAGGSARFDERTGTYRQPTQPVQAPPQGGQVYMGGSARFDERTGQYRSPLPPSVQAPQPAQNAPKTSQEAYAQGGLDALIRFAQSQGQSPSTQPAAQPAPYQTPQRQVRPSPQDAWRQAVYATLLDTLNRRSAQPVQPRYRMF